MPLWRIYHPENFFSSSEKQQLADAITGLYTSFLPAFYVDVLFVPLASADIFVGGKPRDTFVRLAGEHIARNFNGDKARMTGMMNRFNAAVTPLLKAKGADWEAHIAETPFELWCINGISPPAPGSEQEAIWRSQGKPVEL